MNVINKAFSELEANGVRIVHFKSNCNLDISFSAEADFDVLISNKNRSKCAEILLRNNCRRFEPQEIGWYPGVENWLAFDHDTGRIYHIHLHNQLASGKKLLKDYVLPWSKQVLESSVYDTEHGIYISDPNVEMLLLLTRIAIKATLKKRLKLMLGKWSMGTDMQKEFDWLKARIDRESFLKFAADFYAPDAADKLYAITQKSTVTAADLRYLIQLAENRLKYEHWYGDRAGWLRSWTLRGKDLAHKFYMRKLGGLVNTKKVPTSGGLVIAFIGGDGSGKSTVSKEITKWLNRKGDCERVYMGEGDGKKNLFSMITKGVYRKLKKRKSGKNESVDVSKKDNQKLSFKKYIVQYIHALTIYTIVKDNRKKIIRMHRKKLLGGFTVLDRFPQTQIKYRNDGPKLERYADMLNSGFIRKLAAKEMKLLEVADQLQPDVVFRLNVSAEAAQKRKPDEIVNVDVLRGKLDEVKQLNYSKSVMVDIDTEQPYEDEILEIKRIIWEMIG